MAQRAVGSVELYCHPYSYWAGPGFLSSDMSAHPPGHCRELIENRSGQGSFRPFITAGWITRLGSFPRAYRAHATRPFGESASTDRYDLRP